MSTPPLATTPLRNATVAFIEDDGAVRAGVMTLLESLGIDVVAGATGAEVVAQIVETGARPTLIIADYRLGLRTALEDVPEVIAALSGDVEVVVTTGDTSAEVRTAVEQCGWRLLIKPYRPAELIAVIDGACKRAE